jgi:hypothetical protein
MLFGMLRWDGCVAVYVHGPQGQVLGAFRLKTIQKINCKEINVKITEESRIGEAIIVQNNCNLVSYLQKCYIIIIRKAPSAVSTSRWHHIIKFFNLHHPATRNLFVQRTHEKIQLNVMHIMK